MAYIRMKGGAGSSRLTAVLLLIVGTAVLIFGSSARLRQKLLNISCTETAYGTVAGVNSRKASGSDHTEYQAVINVDKSGGFKYDTILTEWTTHTYTEHDEITIRFDPDNSDSYYIEGYFSGNGIAAVICGGVLLFIGVINLFLYLRSR